MRELEPEPPLAVLPRRDSDVGAKPVGETSEVGESEIGGHGLDVGGCVADFLPGELNAPRFEDLPGSHVELLPEQADQLPGAETGESGGCVEVEGLVERLLQERLDDPLDTRIGVAFGQHSPAVEPTGPNHLPDESSECDTHVPGCFQGEQGFPVEGHSARIGAAGIKELFDPSGEVAGLGRTQVERCQPIEEPGAGFPVALDLDRFNAGLRLELLVATPGEMKQPFPGRSAVGPVFAPSGGLSTEDAPDDQPRRGEVSGERSRRPAIGPDQPDTQAFPGFQGEVSAYNAALMETFIVQDPALYGTLRLNFNDPEAAVAQIERYADHLRVAGIVTCTASIETPGSRRYDPVFAAAAEAGLVIAYHTTQEGRALCSPPSSAGYPSRYVEYHSGLATSAIGHAASMITNGVFARHPKLRILYLEGGIAWTIPLMWQLDADWRRFRSEVPELVKPPSHYLREHIYFTTQPIEEPANGRDLLAAFEELGVDRNIVYSTDFPHWDFDPPDRFLPSCFPAAHRERILWHNAAALYANRMQGGEAA